MSFLKVAHSLYESLDCPKSLALHILLRYKEYDQVVSMDCNPLDYNTLTDFRDAFQATKLLSKNEVLKTSFDREKIAIGKFLEAEEACKRTNYYREKDRANNPIFEWVHNAAIRKISSILGRFDADEFVESCAWGPGVTTKITGRNTSGANKFFCERGITRAAFDFVQPWFRSAYPLWGQHLEDSGGFVIEAGNKVITVPKNAKTDRVIAVEPGINLWFQKGIGSMIRRRLYRAGVDLDSDAKNQQSAYCGSKYRSFATVDFSAASDTISREVVRELMPERWYLLMDLFRSHRGTIDDQALAYEKFSSMGNGFTFELESLIFYSIAVAVTQYYGYSVETVSVFGDDVIVVPEVFDAFVSVSKLYGFTVNRQKSFNSGYFRESCGSYYWNGVDCKPFFLKKKIRKESDVYKAANGLRKLAHRRNTYGCDRALLGPYLLCVGLLRVNPCRIPNGYGDGGLVSNFDEARPTKARHGIEGFFCRSLSVIDDRVQSDGVGILLERLHSRSVDRAYGNAVSLRSSTRQKRKRLLVARWDDMGPWI